MKKQEISGKNEAELKKLLIKAQKDLLDLRMDNSLQKLKNPRSISEKKKEIARIKTKIRIEEISK